MTHATGPLFAVHFRRRRQGRTNYAKRLSLLKSNSPRLVVRRSNKSIIAQLVTFSPIGDQTICQALSTELKTFGFNAKCNVPSAYLVGLLVAKKALAKNVKQCVPDFGLHSASKGGILFAVVKGAVDGGLNTSVTEDKLPSKERISGKHLGVDISTALTKISQLQVNSKQG